jgi:hypothetical protein
MQATKLNDSTISRACNGFAAQTITDMLTAAAKPNVEARDTEIVKVAEAMARAHSSKEAPGAAPAAGTPTTSAGEAIPAIVRLAEARAAEFEASKRSGHAGQ